jgi:hypothetical protein
MANQVYDAAYDRSGSKLFGWAADPYSLVLVDTSFYTFSKAHTTLTDVPSSARVAISGPLTGKACSHGGICTADPMTFSNVTGATAEALIIFEARASDGTSLLAVYLDQAQGLPVSPNSGNIDIIWDTRADYGIFGI